MYPIRFAPSTTGHAHPGTLISALLCWLDARSRGVPFMLRLENLDPERCRPEYETAMLRDLEWLGLDWDVLVRQHEQRPHHEVALDALAERGLLYPCSCSRSRIKSLNRPAPDGGYAYDNYCRERPLPSGGWRACDEPLRVKLPAGEITVRDEGGFDYAQDPLRAMGDPVVRRRDGAMAYHLACVVDDARVGVRRLIRGRDLLPSAPVQVALQQSLGLPTPAYRHHFLLLENHGGKLAKFHGAVGAPVLREFYTSEALCGFLAHLAGLAPATNPCRPADLVDNFRWDRVRRHDLTLEWDGTVLRAEITDPPSPRIAAASPGKVD